MHSPKSLLAGLAPAFILVLIHSEHGQPSLFADALATTKPLDRVPPSAAIATIDAAQTQQIDRVNQRSSDTLPATASIQTQIQPLTSIHILSLKWPNDKEFSKPVRDLWKWKDEVLGDGRDFFVPKPKTLSALQSDILSNTDDCVQECTVLSNCARLEIILITNQTLQEAQILDISQRFASQMLAADHTKSAFSFILDDPSQSIPRDIPDAPHEDAVQIASAWHRIDGAEAVCRHLALIAAGLADRPRRPDRGVVFRPFSSRDAHILLQLKRTKDIASGKVGNQFLEYALRAGKRARSVDVVPDIAELKAYGSGDSKYSSEAPRSLMQRVSQAAIQLAVEPTVEECLEDIDANLNSDSVKDFRNQCESMATNDAELKYIRSLLHGPTIALRKGQFSNEHATEALDHIKISFESWQDSRH